MATREAQIKEVYEAGKQQNPQSLIGLGCGSWFSTTLGRFRKLSQTQPVDGLVCQLFTSPRIKIIFVLTPL